MRGEPVWREADEIDWDWTALERLPAGERSTALIATLICRYLDLCLPRGGERENFVDPLRAAEWALCLDAAVATWEAWDVEVPEALAAISGTLSPWFPNLSCLERVFGERRGATLVDTEPCTPPQMQALVDETWVAMGTPGDLEQVLIPEWLAERGVGFARRTLE